MNYIEIDDRELIKKLQSNDRDTQEEGFETIYYKYAKLAFACIYKIVGNYQDSEDLVNETFLALFNSRNRLLETKNIKYYIVVSAKNNAINFVKKKKLEIVKDDNLIYDETESTYDDGGFDDLVSTLKKILNDEEFQIIYYHVVMETNFEALGKAMSKNTNTIKTIYYRAIEKVNKWYDESEG